MKATPVIFSLTLFLIGCATSPSDRSSGGSTDPSIDASSDYSHGFPIQQQASVVNGRVFLPENTAIVANLEVDVGANTLLWNGTPLKFLYRFEGVYRFFNPENNEVINFNPSDDSGEASASFLIRAKSELDQAASGTLVEIPASAAEEFYRRFRLMNLPETYVGLLARNRYVDGARLTDFSLYDAGSLEFKDEEVILNAEPASFQRETTSDGVIIRIENTRASLAIWPDGGWMIWPLLDSGLALQGHDRVLQDFYLNLRLRLSDILPDQSAPSSPDGSEETKI